jgi:hypothetical protein
MLMNEEKKLQHIYDVLINIHNYNMREMILF